MTPLDGRVAIVTGAAGAIGAATARRLALHGGAVVLADLDHEAAQRVADTITADGGRALAVACDVTDPDQVSAATRTAAETFGGVHVLVNNAAIAKDAPLFAMSAGDWDAVFAVTLRGAFLFSRAVHKHMARARWGRILNVSSLSARGHYGQANYVAAKAGLEGLTRALAIDLGPSGITVNAVAPGFISTPMTQAAVRDFAATEAAIAASTPVRRTGRPDDVAATLVFLAGDDAAFITGQTIHVDGGLSPATRPPAL
ncbi:3-oxoacyl-[acyl-carrier protein] reductase [Amycolatopsis xylanica]|uniref:3-oxoacyl-[acyl-carrier protein] reductase n=1 Tax=Amycolatopsis xylanica TaxID=589385 RepID=A0A1H2U123_9PSEU|nr:SDR family NAD(P)-dependent oxidoreductase [Amycolatopsis xylanica]SDW49886.1 3-oxoacyl-[acyl-carrier protein] reductase [Amycolatopsis xylanica]